MRKFFIGTLCGILLLGLTGCGENNSSNNQEYTKEMQDIRSSHITLLGDATVGEYLDYCIVDQKWSEDDSYTSDKGNGAIILKGKDKKTGDSIEILWIKNLDCASCLSNMHEIKIGDEEGGYSSYLSYLSEYKSEVLEQSNK